MGEDKSFLPFGKYPTLIEYQYNKLSQVFSKVYISSKTDKFDFTANLILDNEDISSPMVALQSILKKFNNKVFIITVDIPLVKQETINTLVKNSNNYDITIAADKDKIHNLCGIFSKDLLNKINTYLIDNIHKINYLIKNSKTNYINFEDSSQFININTKEEYKKALTIYKKY